MLHQVTRFTDTAPPPTKMIESHVWKNWIMWLSCSIENPWTESESYSNKDDWVARLKELKHVTLKFNRSSMDRNWKLRVWIRNTAPPLLQKDDRVPRLKELKRVNLEFNQSSMDKKWKLPVWIQEKILMYLQRYAFSMGGCTQPELQILLSLTNQGEMYSLNVSTNCKILILYKSCNYEICSNVVDIEFVQKQTNCVYNHAPWLVQTMEVQRNKSKNCPQLKYWNIQPDDVFD